MAKEAEIVKFGANIDYLLSLPSVIADYFLGKGKEDTAVTIPQTVNYPPATKPDSKKPATKIVKKPKIARKIEEPPSPYLNVPISLLQHNFREILETFPQDIDYLWENNICTIIVSILDRNTIKLKKLIVLVDFFITTISHGTSENYQMIKTFKDFFITFFDRGIGTYRISGILVEPPKSDILEAGQYTTFQDLYNSIISGSNIAKLSQHPNYIIESGLTFLNFYKKGFITDISFALSSAQSNIVNFSFSFIVPKEETGHITLFDKTTVDITNLVSDDPDVIDKLHDPDQSYLLESSGLKITSSEGKLFLEESHAK